MELTHLNSKMIMQFVTRQRISRAEHHTRETSRSLLAISLEPGYMSPSLFAQVFPPRRFRSSL